MRKADVRRGKRRKAVGVRAMIRPSLGSPTRDADAHTHTALTPHTTHAAYQARARAPAATAAAAAAQRRALLAVRARPRLRVAPPDHVLPRWYFLRPTLAYETDRVSTFRFNHGRRKKCHHAVAMGGGVLVRFRKVSRQVPQAFPRSRGAATDRS